MTELLQLTETQRRDIFNQVGFLEGLSPKVVEKDWWVTLTLRAVFQTAYAPHLLFKGGTSLSKCWKLIQRFSEDIDLAINREFLGFGGDLSNNAIHRLKKAACAFTSNELKTAIEEQFQILGVPEGMVTIIAKEVPVTFPDTDPQELRIAYSSLYDPIDYIPDLVKVEVGARSLKDPWSSCSIQSIVGERLSGQSFSGQPFEIPAVEPGRTFLEKLFLLHEEFLKLDNIRHLRMSRHLFDVVRVMNTIYGWKAIMDEQLYETIRLHRSKYTKLHGVDYTTHAKGTINFIPPESILKEYRDDYQVMRERMIHDEMPPGFDEIMNELTMLRTRIQNPISFHGRTIEEIVANAIVSDPKDSLANSMIEGSKVIIPVDFTVDPHQPSSSTNVAARYEVEFTRKNKELVTPRIRIVGENISQ